MEITVNQSGAIDSEGCEILSTQIEALRNTFRALLPDNANDIPEEAFTELFVEMLISHAVENFAARLQDCDTKKEAMEVINHIFTISTIAYGKFVGRTLSRVLYFEHEDSEGLVTSGTEVMTPIINENALKIWRFIDRMEKEAKVDNPQDPVAALLHKLTEGVLH